VYLKKIDLDKRLVSDKVCYEITELLMEINTYEVSTMIIREKDRIIIKLHDKMVNVNITDSGYIYAYDYCNSSVIKTSNVEAYHLLTETQWIDPTKEMPEHDVSIVGKFRDDKGNIVIAICKWIAKRDMFSGGNFEYFSSGIMRVYALEWFVGWLPIENVIL